MHLKIFTVAALHGFLNLRLNFLEDLTVIVGPNGSGKTSALALISALLRLDVATMRSMEFETATLVVEDTQLGEVSVVAANTRSELRLGLTRNGVSVDLLSAPYPPTLRYTRTAGNNLFLHTSSVAARAPEIWTSSAKDMLIYSTPDPLVLHAEAAEFLERARLTFVQLDRTIVAMDAEGNQALELRNPSKSKTAKGVVRDPIEEVIKVARQRYLEYKTSVERIKDRAYLDSLRLHFKPIDPALQEKKMEKKAFNLKLRNLRDRVDKSSMTSDQPELRSFATKFFDEFQQLIDASIQKSAQKRLGRRTLDDEQLEAILNLKQLQIEDLLNVFETEYRSTQDAYAPIRAYLALTDKFLGESGKKLVFDHSYELRFLLQGEHATSSEPRSLKELSSGERQILIILSYLAFVSGEQSVFVVDEPELSLHLAWQGYLIDAMKDLRPEGCQIIVATHAPEIAGRVVENCTNLQGEFASPQ
jgi:predicted ATPase